MSSGLLRKFTTVAAVAGVVTGLLSSIGSAQDPDPQTGNSQSGPALTEPSQKFVEPPVISEPAPEPDKTEPQRYAARESGESDWQITIVPRNFESSDTASWTTPELSQDDDEAAAVSGINPRHYRMIYNAIPFNRAEYNASPSYRHDAAMEILFGRMRPTVIHRNSPQPSAVAEHQCVRAPVPVQLPAPGHLARFLFPVLELPHSVLIASGPVAVRIRMPFRYDGLLMFVTVA